MTEPEKSEKPSEEIFISRKNFLLVCLLFTLGLILLSTLLINIFHQKTLLDIFTKGMPWRYQVIHGSLYGILASTSILAILKIKYFENANYFFVEILKTIRLNIFDIFLISLCAGISEELFFRATLQPWLGLWFTSILFIALHGYLDFTKSKLFILGLIMVLVAIGLGFMFKYVGIISAITAHTVFDIIMLFHFVKKNNF